jgi:hypothetical protein
MSFRPGHDGDPRIPVLINLPACLTAISVVRSPGRRSTVWPSGSILSQTWCNPLLPVGDYPVPCGSASRCVEGDISAVMGEDRPGDPGELVGQGNGCYVAVGALKQAFEPATQGVSLWARRGRAVRAPWMNSIRR